MPARSPRPGTAEGFRPPTYPYDRLKPLKAKAAALTGGAVDLSVGSPCDPPSPAVIEALASSDEDWAARAYPSSAGSETARDAISQWMAARLDVWAPPQHIGLCIGTKELVAGLPSFLHLRDPSRDTVLYPELSYPTYRMGALLAGLRAVPVPVDGEFRLRLGPGAVREEDAERALVLWVNSPGNPAGQLDNLRAAVAWARRHEVLVASDECYVEHTWSAPPQSVLGHGGGDDGLDGVIAVHSLSKRSNLAGLRFGWYAGDPGVVEFLREVRQHAGFMVPGPVQRAGVAALHDLGHAAAQAERYWGRLVRLREILNDAGVEAPLPEGGIYIWAPAPGGDAWALAERLAADGGMVVSPGEFYGTAGAGHIRVAAVAPLERVELVAKRLRRARGRRSPAGRAKKPAG